VSHFRLLVGDALEQLRKLADESVQTCVTSPPYWGLRDYGVEGQIGLEATPAEFLGRLVEVFREVRRVLKPEGTAWVNMGDTYASAGLGGGVGTRSTVNGQQSHKAARSHHQVARRQAPARHAARSKLKNRVVAGLKPKDLVGAPWRLAFALQDDGWWLRQDIIWAKPNPMPESVTDRCTKSHEYVFLLAKAVRYFYDADAIRTPLAAKTFTAFGTTRRSKGNDALGKVAADNWSGLVRLPRVDESGAPVGANARSVWTIATTPTPLEHFAAFPEELARRCIVAGSQVGDTVLDPFAGTGTTGIVALREGRRFVGCELNPAYAEMAEQRSREVTPSLFLAGGAA